MSVEQFLKTVGQPSTWIPLLLSVATFIGGAKIEKLKSKKAEKDIDSVDIDNKIKMRDFDRSEFDRIYSRVKEMELELTELTIKATNLGIENEKQAGQLKQKTLEIQELKARLSLYETINSK